MTDPIVTDVTKVEGFWAKNGRYVLWAAFLIAGFVIGRVV
jgi:hypothetical protein